MNILILGAGLMQKPAILSAKELGFTVCVIDANDKAVAIPYAHKFKKIDLKDKEGILEYAKELQLEQNGGLAGVFTAGTDFSASVSYVCQKLSLPSHSFLAATNASVKTQMRQCFKNHNVPSPEFFSVSKEQIQSESQINQLLQTITSKIEYPFVVKPVDNMGARGCRMVRSQNEFASAIKVATESSRTNTAIAEEYMEGPEYSIDALVYNGTFTITGFAERHIKYPPYFIEVGHTMPAILEEDKYNQLVSVFALGAKSLGLTTGAAKADIKWTKNGPMIGEIAGRLSGGYMSGWTYPYASDINLTKQGILIACGKEPEQLIKNRISVKFQPSEKCKNAEKPYELFQIPCKRTSAERAWMSIPGTVEYIENIQEFTDKAVFDTLPRATVSLGSKVDFPRNNIEKCGNIISVSHNHQIAQQVSQDAVSNIFITLKPNTKETDDFLQCKTYDDEKDFPPSAFGKLTQNQLEKIEGTIPKDSKVQEFIPEIIKKDFSEKIDWNYNTVLSTVQKFDILRPKHPELKMKDFWQALLRGGIQGAVYFSDSIK